MSTRFAFGPFVLDTNRGTLSRDGALVAVGHRGLLVLQSLLAAQGAVVDKASLMERAWPGLVVEESNLSVQIAALRKLLGTAPDGSDWIVTVPRSGYRLAGATHVADAGPANGPEARASQPGQRPSIAVLPFNNLSTDPDQEYFADGITDDVIAALTRFRWFSVAGRTPSFAYKTRPVDAKTVGRELGVGYVVQGSVRKSGDKVRIAVELVDADNGHCVWADRYDFDLVDVFAVQDQIAQRVAGSIEPELLMSETGTVASRQRTGTVTGWDLVAQGCWFFHQVTRPTHERARELFRQARQLDPDLVEARIWLARVDAGILAFGWSDHLADAQHEGMTAALEAVQMDEKSCYAHYALAAVGVFSSSFDLAIRAAEKAVEVSPSFALGHLVLGMARLYSGDAEGAVAPLEQGLELNRHDPHDFIWYNVLALAFLLKGDAREGLQHALTSLKIRPQWRSSMETAAACCAALGRLEVARQWNEQFARVEKAPGDALDPLWRNNPGWAQTMRKLLAAAR